MVTPPPSPGCQSAAATLALVRCCLPRTSRHVCRPELPSRRQCGAGRWPSTTSTGLVGIPAWRGILVTLVLRWARCPRPAMSAAATLAAVVDRPSATIAAARVRAFAPCHECQPPRPRGDRFKSHAGTQGGRLSRTGIVSLALDDARPAHRLPVSPPAVQEPHLAVRVAVGEDPAPAALARHLAAARRGRRGLLALGWCRRVVCRVARALTHFSPSLPTSGAHGR